MADGDYYARNLAPKWRKVGNTLLGGQDIAIVADLATQAFAETMRLSHGVPGLHQLCEAFAVAARDGARDAWMDTNEAVRRATRHHANTEIAVMAGEALLENHAERLRSMPTHELAEELAAATADRIAGYHGAHARKLAFSRMVVEQQLALTVNAVVHRANISRISALVETAAALGAGRVEIAHAQYYGWALRNRKALMPTSAQVAQAMQEMESIRPRYAGRLVIDMVVPDYYARRPKACMGGWARRSLNVTPSGRVLPCHAAETIPGLEFWSVRDRPLAEIWHGSPAFQAFRGTDWMREPCRSCDMREIDFGGCRRQALAIAGDAAATDPACELSPRHAAMRALAESDAAIADDEYQYRGRSATQSAIAIPAR